MTARVAAGLFVHRFQERHERHLRTGVSVYKPRRTSGSVRTRDVPVATLPRYNIASSQPLPIIREPDRLDASGRSFSVFVCRRRGFGNCAATLHVQACIRYRAAQAARIVTQVRRARRGERRQSNGR